ncbi:hypothetical protein SAY86_007905 [Trapa natans]|uniref:Endonuclease/exonuclease/phosphatase domain-containing protein n=1 Tax=Trapa natans TaxID=22666 RepID=A0AAN7LMI8_TRANT|nr:hypothetical protein SAY86_007905 [Trapa natans]
MRRSAPSVRSLSVSASTSAASTMSFAPRYRGGGRGQWQRSFSDQGDGAGRGHYMAGGSGGQSFEDAGFTSQGREERVSLIRMESQPRPFHGRQPYNRLFHPPLPYNHYQQSPQAQSRPPFNRGRPYNNHNQSFRFRPPSPPYNHNQQFAPPQQYNQNPRLYQPQSNIQNRQFPQKPLHYPNSPFYPSPQHYQNQGVGPSDQSPPRPPQVLNYRNWEFSRSEPHPNFKRFVVLSYNILADYLALNHRGKLYYHIPRYMLEWNWRKRSIIFELGLWSADIMCFQEVDRFQDLEEELKLRGYNGTWKMRTGDPVDGCAIFWRTSRFKLLHEEFIEYNKLGLRDNVAQICVFEFMNEDVIENAGGSPLSSAGSNRIVVCNIHVLYNPRRGEIKLGQIRVLLNSAHDISKSWDNAPIVLCGDFNCTPESPLYNFISHQQLDISGVDRDKLSGQASAEIHGTRAYIYNNQGLPTDKSIQDLPKVENAWEYKQPNQEVTNGGLKKALDMSDEACSSHASCDKIEDITGSLGGGGFPEDLGIVVNIEQEFSDDLYDLSKESMELRSKANVPDETNITSVTASDKSSHTFANNEDPVPVLVEEKLKVFSLNELQSIDNNIYSSAMAEGQSSLPIVNDGDSAVELVDEELQVLSLNKLDDPAKEKGESSSEDDATFLEALHDGEESFAPESSSRFEVELPEEGRSVYDPSAWTSTEIATATGSEDCVILEHKLKLKSTYTEVEDISRTRDSNGEPHVTSYNSRFMGTVDYIWRSEGLQTVRVLAPIPKQAMQQWTQGFPTKKWGSDHIALVSELAITAGGGVSDQETQNQVQ